MSERKKILLRLDPAVHDAVARWAADELRSTNAQIEFLLRRALGDAGRMPGDAGRPVRRGRPRKRTDDDGGGGDGGTGGGTDGGTGGEADGTTDALTTDGMTDGTTGTTTEGTTTDGGTAVGSTPDTPGREGDDDVPGDGDGGLGDRDSGPGDAGGVDTAPPR